MDEFEELRLKVRSTPRFRSKDVCVESDVPKSICLSKYGFERTAQLQGCTAALIAGGGGAHYGISGTKSAGSCMPVPVQGSHVKQKSKTQLATAHLGFLFPTRAPV